MAIATTTTSNLLESGKAALDLARRQTLRLAQDIPPDKLCHQPVPNANHALWVLGHLAVSDDYFQSQLGGRKPVLDESWNKLFATGSKPTSNRSAYPKLDEVKAGMERSRKALLDWLGSLDDRKLMSPMPANWTEFAPTFAALAGTVAWHEGLHAGQLSVVRRSLGLPPTM